MNKINYFDCCELGSYICLTDGRCGYIHAINNVNKSINIKITNSLLNDDNDVLYIEFLDEDVIEVYLNKGYETYKIWDIINKIGIWDVKKIKEEISIIKPLDKPLDISAYSILELANKVNEIIKYINNKESETE